MPKVVSSSLVICASDKPFSTFKVNFAIPLASVCAEVAPSKATPIVGLDNATWIVWPLGLTVPVLLALTDTTTVSPYTLRPAPASLLIDKLYCAFGRDADNNCVDVT